MLRIQLSEPERKVVVLSQLIPKESSRIGKGEGKMRSLFFGKRMATG